MQGQENLSVLFVDDDPAILKLLLRMLVHRSDHWRMEFAGNAVQALELMTRAPFDVVVSDLQMPGMNGIEFLKVVRERYPLATRIIYSGNSDQQSILGCVGLIHQFLPKPCPAASLEAAIERTAAVNSLLPNRAMREKLSKMERILSMPALYMELMRQLRSLETPIDEIASTVSQDIGMTSQILKIVNSAFFGLSQPISNVAQAISFLGIETVKNLALAIGVFSQFTSRKLGGISLEALWHHSMRTAQAAKLIAKSESASREIVDHAFAAGLLHDLGKLIIAANYPRECEEIRRNAPDKGVEWIIAEREVFGFDHAEVGGCLLGLWGLPLAVVEGVAFHHVPSRSSGTEFSGLTAVHAANVLIQTQGLSHGGIAPPKLDLAYLAKMGVLASLERWREVLASAQTL